MQEIQFQSKESQKSSAPSCRLYFVPHAAVAVRMAADAKTGRKGEKVSRKPAETGAMIPVLPQDYQLAYANW